MPLNDPDTTVLPVLDEFHGPEALVNLSQRLMDWDEGEVSDQEIADAMGPRIVPAFRYAQEKLRGKVRKVTLEPAFCHSADVAMRAQGLRYRDDVKIACLLHDVAEDTSRTIRDLPRALDDIETRFSPEHARDVRVLTNRYQLIFKGVGPKVHKDTAPDRRGLDAFRAALDVHRYELSRELVARFETEFVRLADFLAGDIDLAEAVKVSRRDKKFTLAKYLERQSYGLYIQDVIDDAADIAIQSQGRTQPVPLIVKYMDIIDNVRTSEVSNRLALYKLVQKAETVLDGTSRRFLLRVRHDVAVHSTIETLHRIVQIRLVDQIKLRRRAVAENFSETRFASLVKFLANEAKRLTNKYDIPRDRVAAVEALEHQLQQMNMG